MTLADTTRSDPARSDTTRPGTRGARRRGHGAGGTTAGAPRRRRRPWSARRVLTLAALVVMTLLWIYPFIWLVSASLKQSSEIFSSGLNLMPETFRWENYLRAWTEAGFAQYFLNTVIITVGAIVIVVVRSALAGYVLGRYAFPGKRILIGIFLVTFFLPEGYTIIPVTQLTDQLGLLNTHAGVILGLSAGGHIASTLLYAGFFRGLPKELEESAKLDGAGAFRTFFQVMLPLSWPITATVTILTFLAAWNAYLLPLVFTLSTPELQTLAIGMTSFVSDYGQDWSGMAAGAVISLVPVVIVFVILQRKFVDSIAGAVKQ